MAEPPDYPFELVRYPAAELVLDDRIYPRDHVSPDVMHKLSLALDAGETLKPVRADRASLRVTDGWHRTKEFLRRDLTAVISVELVDYPDENSLLLDAVAQNSRHGAGLTSLDQARAILLCRDRHIDAGAIAEALAVPIATLDRITDRRTAYRSDGQPVIIKRSFRHLAGATLTPQQISANVRATGWSPAYLAGQIIRLIEADAVDWGDDRVVDALTRLHQILSGRLVP